MLSVALQGLFWAVIKTIDAERGGWVTTIDEIAEVAWELVRPELGAWSDRTVGALLDEYSDRLPLLEDFTNEDHEIERCYRIVGSADRPAVAVDGIYLLASLAARGLREHPYQEFDFEAGHFGADDIHLLSLRQRAADWRGLTVESWIGWLATAWGVEQHFRVALRKLRYQGDDTFRIRPLDDRLLVVEAPKPSFTAPRLRQAEQFLRDLGLIELDEDEQWSLTDPGVALLEECRRG
jgi:hypothetical protein